MAERIKLRCTNKNTSICALADEIKESLAAEFVCDERRLNDTVIMLCLEEYYFRCSSYVSLSILLIEDTMYQEAVIIGFGGGEGLLNISWGANKSFAKRAVKILKKHGFTEYQSDENHLTERFEFRSIQPDEVEQAAEIEQICFPPNEACSKQHIEERIAKAPELFLVAVDKETGKIAGFLNGLSTNETVFRDEFFTDADLYEPQGETVMLLGLDVLPDYRMQGLARAIVQEYSRREQANGRKRLVLTCLQAKVEMYKKMGFQDNGIANSTWGGEEWHEMYYDLK